MLDQLRRRCQQEAHEFQDVENWHAAMAVMAAYDMDDGEERRPEAVDGWAAKWAARLGAMLRLPGDQLHCVKSQETEEP